MATSTPTASNAAIVAVPKPVTSPNRNLVPVGNRLGPIGNKLSLQNGMTAGYGDNDGNTSNPPAWPGTYGGNPNKQPHRIGLMRNVGNTLNKQFTLYFIFNPNEITSSFAIDTTQIPANYVYGNPTAGDNASIAVPNIASSQTVSWSLIFDRTYDMMYGSKKAGTDPRLNRGVLRDVAALYNLVGTFENKGAVPLTTPVEVVFGQTESGQLWGFTGFIISAVITYGIFRYNMIPSRCEVDIQMMASYVAPQTPTSGGSGGSTGSIIKNGKVVSNSAPLGATARTFLPASKKSIYGVSTIKSTTTASGKVVTTEGPSLMVGSPPWKTPDAAATYLNNYVHKLGISGGKIVKLPGASGDYGIQFGN